MARQTQDPLTTDARFDGVMNLYKAIDFPSGMIARATTAKSINKAFEENPNWDPVIFCDGPHMLGPVLILKWSGD